MLATSWQRPQPDLLARALQPLSWIYRGAASLHRSLYSSGLRARQRAPVPLIVVGNFVAGGAGKTPTVIALVEQMRQRGYTPGVVSRGYGRRDDSLRSVARTSTPDEVGDEPLLILLRTGAPVTVAGRRIDAARALCAAHPTVDLLIADDGLQHHAMARDAQVIVFDERGVGNGLLLPAGPLRQPMPPCAPERSIVLYNAERASTPWPGYLATRIVADPVPLAEWWHGERADAGTWAQLRGRRVVACAGVAMPQRFFSMLQQQGLTIEPVALPDHASFDALPWPASAVDVVITEKDAVKVRPERVGATRVWVAPLDFGLDAQVGATLAQWLQSWTTA
ncbi:MAG: tetraacyldisaccharide 4'-kinase [Burkholderiaceae bacterium]|nr:tetraacyldisaccharide 4'-kinase [Burkholderiaceae bacterium]